MKNFDYKNENVRSLFSENGADAPAVFSDMYDKRYMSEKITSRCSQYGRSMIEMLGVLAIIGVLSVGGIAGYSKAMMKFRINKFIEQITLLSQNIRTFYSTQNASTRYRDIQISSSDCQRIFSGNISNPTDVLNCPTATIFMKAKLIENDWIGNGTGYAYNTSNPTGLINPFGGNISVYPYISKYFIISSTNIPVEACIDLLTQDWSSVSSGLVGLGISSSYEASTSGNKVGFSNPITLPVPIDTATTWCSGINSDGNRYINFYYE